MFHPMTCRYLQRWRLSSMAWCAVCHTGCSFGIVYTFVNTWRC